MIEPQDPPFAVQIELTEGCSLACDFCGINGIREKQGNYKFLTYPAAYTIAERMRTAMDQHTWNPRIEFAMHGEPSMNPDLISIIAMFRKTFGPKTSMVMFSNGTGFLKDPNTSINELLEAGINTIGLDAYEHVDFVPRILEKYEGKYPVYRYPEQKEHNLHSGRRIGRRDIVVIKDISIADTGNHSSLNTHCGGGMKPAGVMQGRCAKPFRELAIRWDGNVALCCNDFRGIYKVGNVLETPLHQLWNDEAFQAARKFLMQGDRSIAPCNTCNAKSMRVGLLPDKMGRVSLPAPTEVDRATAQRAAAGDPYTRPVRRQWESQPGTELFPVATGQVYPLNLLDPKRFA